MRNDKLDSFVLSSRYENVQQRVQRLVDDEGKKNVVLDNIEQNYDNVDVTYNPLKEY